jgi:hypothetical protein
MSRRFVSLDSPRLSLFYLSLWRMSPHRHGMPRIRLPLLHVVPRPHPVRGSPGLHPRMPLRGRPHVRLMRSRRMPLRGRSPRLHLHRGAAGVALLRGWSPHVVSLRRRMALVVGVALRRARRSVGVALRRLVRARGHPRVRLRPVGWHAGMRLRGHVATGGVRVHRVLVVRLHGDHVRVALAGVGGHGMRRGAVHVAAHRGRALVGAVWGRRRGRALDRRAHGARRLRRRHRAALGRRASHCLATTTKKQLSLLL